jgi:predicted DsbA family dithiol-disulfide isomerase
LARQYSVSGVPKTVIDGTIEVLGAEPEDVFVGHFLEGSTGGPVA